MRSLITLCIVGALIFVGATVKLGKYTLFGHISRIWKAEETQELVDGVKETSKPVVDRVKKGVKAGWEDSDGGAAASKVDAGAETGSAGGVEDLRKRAVDEVADKAGDAAKDAVKARVKDELGGDGARP